MRKIIILPILFLNTIGYSQELTIIEQDYDRARKIANHENKLLFIDFYTTWCAPCKKMDKWIFQNDSLSQRLGTGFVLLRYDAENDSMFNLSKKHHVNSYPTGIVINRDGYVLNRKYGFLGDDIQELSESVFEFANSSIELNRQNKVLKGYSNKIDMSKYPRFYIDFVNRDNTKVTATKEFKNFWSEKQDILSEEYFSPLVYFAKDVPVTIADNFLKNKEKYTELFGETDVSVALFFLSAGKFESAIASKNQAKFNRAIEFSKKAMGEESTKQILPLFEKKFAESKNK